MHVLAASGEVSRHAAEREADASGEDEHRADDDEDQAEPDKEFAEISHGQLLHASGG
jgi:hypothetical protein